VAEPDRSQPRETVAAAGTAEENRALVAHRLAASVGEDRRTFDQTWPLLLAATGREPPHAVTVWEDWWAGSPRSPCQPGRRAHDRIGCQRRGRAREGKLSERRVERGAVASSGALARDTNGSFLGPRELLALQTRLTVALGGGQEYLLGRRKVDNGSSGKDDEVRRSAAAEA
jgi:hypothetical protein